MERAYGLEIPQNLEEVCHPDRMALLVYDLQVGIMSQLPQEKGGLHQKTSFTGITGC